MNSSPHCVLCAVVAFVVGLGAVALAISPRAALAGDPPKPVVAPPTSGAQVTVDADGTVYLPALKVPFSSFASPQAKAAFIETHKELEELLPKLDAMNVAEQRQAEIDHFRAPLKRTRELYSVVSIPHLIAGVYVDEFTPKDGVDARNRNRILINLHGGGFMYGARIMGAMESIPVAGLGKFKVLAIDYRLAPEYKFPAATEDVVAVYKALLKHYKPQNIGIYGCSAGGMLTGEVIAWIEKEHLPPPGAIGIFCASADLGGRGDSAFLGPSLMGVPPPVRSSDQQQHPSIDDNSYFSDADINDPLVAPINSLSVLKRFPPTLIITSTRDDELSPAVYTHTQLVKLGVEAELHVWEGMNHGFFTIYPDLPETKEVWDVVTRFFDQHLGAKRREQP